MIDSDGFRANIGIIVCNDFGNLLWTRRIGQNSWQFPQGGVDAGETAEQALFRELKEEIGLDRQDVKILGSTKNWLKYRLPNRYIRQDSYPLCVGQKQKWYMLRLTSNESRIHFDETGHPEFDHFMWVNYWYPLRQVISFKQEVYREALGELIHCVMDNIARQRKQRGRRNNRKGKAQD
ncbi:RNA pyrophosphohydrolase [Aliikangiella sp. IMCC44359]|uniref:RNA pyrophosphohydrolase n=1 Tax=Aliikangiella sp. IMCC44359 TaxID=3459125 RepID=UPI00403A8D29